MPTIRDPDGVLDHLAAQHAAARDLEDAEQLCEALARAEIHGSTPELGSYAKDQLLRAQARARRLVEQARSRTS